MGVKKNNGRRKGSFLAFLIFFVGVPFLLVRGCTAAPSQIENAVETAVGKAVPSSVTTVFNPRNVSYNKKQNVYELTGPVVDTANVLTSSQYSELDGFLRRLSETSGVQIAVLTVRSLGGEDIESFSLRHAEAWKLGQNGVDNGALLTVAMEEHDVRIETGYGTEGALTDAQCARILRNVIIPEFRAGDYGEGIIEGVKNMAGIITSDESLVNENVKSEVNAFTEDGIIEDRIAFYIFMGLTVFIFFIVIIGSIARSLFPHSPLFRWIFLSRMFGGGSNHRNYGGNIHTGGGNFGGGGFRGGGFHGGGGGFGGGGASGHW